VVGGCFSFCRLAAALLDCPFFSLFIYLLIVLLSSTSKGFFKFIDCTTDLAVADFFPAMPLFEAFPSETNSCSCLSKRLGPRTGIILLISWLMFNGLSICSLGLLSVVCCSNPKLSTKFTTRKLLGFESGDFSVRLLFFCCEARTSGSFPPPSTFLSVLRLHTRVYVSDSVLKFLTGCCRCLESF